MSLTDQICKLLPSGSAWPKYVGSNLYATVDLFSGAVQRFLTWIDYGKGESNPLTATDSLDTWELAFGVPDPLGPQNLTPGQQRIQMVSRLQDLGGQSPQFYIDYVKQFGYDITITELSSSKVGSTVGVRSYSTVADHTWVVTVANATLTLFRAGQNVAGDPLSQASDITWLMYELRRVAPAHTLISWVTT